jgi:predicted secreted protein
MKKFLILFALVAGATTTASMKAAGSSSASEKDYAAELRETRACNVLLKKMSQSSDADNWRNRMRAWTCRQRSDAARAVAMKAG